MIADGKDPLRSGSLGTNEQGVQLTAVQLQRFADAVRRQPLRANVVAKRMNADLVLGGCCTEFD
jgi:hypothetical protein